MSNIGQISFVKKEYNTRYYMDDNIILNVSNVSEDSKLFIKFPTDVGDGTYLPVEGGIKNGLLTVWMHNQTSKPMETHVDFFYNYSKKYEPVVEDWDLVWNFDLILVTYGSNEEILGKSSVSTSFKMESPVAFVKYNFEAIDSLTQELTGAKDIFIPYVSQPKLTIDATTADSTNVIGYRYVDSLNKEDIESTENFKEFKKLDNKNMYFACIFQDKWLKNDRTMTYYIYIYLGVESSDDVINSSKTDRFCTMLQPTFLDYFTPAVTSIAVNRPEELSTKVNAVVEGTFWNKNFGAKNNNITLKYRTKLSSQNDWSAYTEVVPTIAGNIFGFNGQLNVNVPTDQSLEVQFLVEDSCKMTGTLKGSTTVSKSVIDYGDKYFNVNGEMCNNDRMVVSMEEVNSEDHSVKLYDCDGNKINIVDYVVVGQYDDSKD